MCSLMFYLNSHFVDGAGLVQPMARRSPGKLTPGSTVSVKMFAFKGAVAVDHSVIVYLF